MAKSVHDVLILGAGAAGLAAADELAGSGRSVLLLDARDRVGGRIWTLSGPGRPIPVELGAEFIHGEPAATFGLLRRFGIAAVDATGPHWSLRRGRLCRREDEFAALRKALRTERRRVSSRDLTFDELLARVAPDRLSGEARSFARTLVEGFDAADPARVSARSILEEWVTGDALDSPQFRPLGGYGAVLAPLASSLGRGEAILALQSVVHTVRWRKASVRVEGSRLGEPFAAEARSAVVTLPLGVLQGPPGAPGSVRFEPPLTDKARAIARLAPGPVLKAVLHFRDPFWEEAGGGRCRDAAFFHAPDAPFPTFWTALPVRVPMLVAWAGGPKAARLAGATHDDLIGAALASLRALFRQSRNRRFRLESATLHDWQRDPFARGAYSYVLAHGGNARRALARPLGATLYFAGEAADAGGEAGTVAGALQSGRAAARRILRRAD